MESLFFNVLAQYHLLLRKVKIILFITAMFLIPLYAFPQTAVAPASGDGTSENPYQVASLENLYWLAQDTARWKLHYIQTADIDASATSGWNYGKGWSPIGNIIVKFKGSYNGDGHTISGLYINRPDEDYQGLFGYGLSTSVSNLGLNSFTISGRNYVGGIIADMSYSLMSDCQANGTVTGVTHTFGCLIGRAYESTIIACNSSGNVNGPNNTGGLAGSCAYSEISFCYSDSEVNGTASYTGGLIGNIHSSDLKGCYSAGNAAGSGYVGGLAGVSTFSFIDDSYSRGNVSGVYYLGGLAGSIDNTTISNSYSTGSVESNGLFGGFVGNSVNSSVINSFWDTVTSGQLSSYGGTGKTTAEMKTFSVFANAGWDFKGLGMEETWNIGNGRNVGYPYLDWQFPGDEAPDELSVAFSKTIKVSNLQGASAVVSCAITNTGNPKAFQHGVCWNTVGDPTISDNSTFEGEVSSAGEYYSTMTGLTEDTEYYVRAYIINSIDTTYGNELYFISCVSPEGSGTEADPYKIASLAHLHWIVTNTSLWDKHFEQVTDIDAQAVLSWNDGKGWMPIGNLITKFTGSYDGGGHTISGLFINRTDMDYQGFFGYADSASFSNLGLTGLDINGKSYFGGLAGYILNSFVTNCYVSGSVKGTGMMGGLLGYIVRSVVDDCHSTCEIDGSQNYIGGLVGYNSSYSVIRNSYYNGIINGGSVTGGLAGTNTSHSIIINSFSSGTVGGSSGTGGVAGTNSAYATISKSYNVANVTGTSSVGGITGINSNFSGIHNSFNRGNITGTQYIGGITGNNNTSEIVRTYSTGLITGSAYTGGLAGNNNLTITGSFWDTETSGQAESAGGTGKTTAEMKTFSTFTLAEWDFKGLGIEETWNIGNSRNDGYPYFNWQFPGDEGTSEPSVALVSTVGASPVSANSVNVTGAIINTGNPKAGQHGVCWNTAGSPTIADSKTQEGPVTQAGNYVSAITGLGANITYHSRAYVTDDYGTSYGKTVSFVTSAPPTGSGTAEDPWLISSLAHLFWMASDTARWDKHYKQIANINATATQNWNEGEGWIPVGNTTVPFSGNYNGNGYAIDGLFINRENSDQLGLFGNLFSAKISDLRLININVIGRHLVGGLAGEMTISDINRCIVTGNLSIDGITNSYSYVGLVAGRSSNSTITNSYAEGFISSNSQYVGGLAGHCTATTIRNSFTSGNVNGRSSVGGIVGHQTSSYISNSYSTSYVGGEQNRIGGLAGDQANSTISNSYCLGDVSGSSEIGGLVGYNYTNSHIVNCYSTGNVTGYGTNIGGLVGQNVSSSVKNSFWNTETSGQMTSAGGTGIITGEMQYINTFTSLETFGLEEAWDFTGNPNDDNRDENIWDINAGLNEGYPYHTWQICGSYSGEYHPMVSDPVFPPDILNHPEDRTVCPLTGTSFRVDPLYNDDVTSYQWQMKAPAGSWTDVAGAMFSGINMKELVLTGITSAYNNYQFQCVLSNLCGPSATSDAATLTLIAAPDFIIHPQPATVCEGGNTSMTVETTGQGEMEYRWKKDGNNITSWSASPDLILENILLSAAGYYTVLVRDECGNTEESNSAYLTVNPKPAVSLGDDRHLCPGEILILDPGAGYTSYLWSTDATTQTISVSTEGIYTVIVTDNNTCSNQASVTVTVDPDIPAPDLGEDITICQGTSTTLSTGEQYDTYLWSTDASTSSILVSNTGTYWVDVKNNNSVCVKRDSINVFVQKPYEDEEICMVLIDPDSEKNMIVWEKTENVATLRYQVFKMVSGGGYALVGERMFADSAWVIDYSSNPSSQADAYVLVTIDTCGNASVMSKWHKPFLLQSSPGFDVINLNWSPYLIDGSEIISAGVHIFKSITIFRGTTPSNLSQIGSVIAGIGSYSYIDNTVPLDVRYYYRIGGEKDPPCNPNNLPLKKASSGPFVHSFSNLEDNQRTTGTGNDNIGDAVLIYPNPMSDRAIIQVGRNYTLPVRLRLTDLSGRVIRETMHFEHLIELDRGNLSSGAYIVEVRGEMVYKGVLMVR